MPSTSLQSFKWAIKFKKKKEEKKMKDVRRTTPRFIFLETNRDSTFKEASFA